MGLVPFPLKFVLGLLYQVLGGQTAESTTDALAKSGPFVLVVGALVIAPLLETIIGQWVPILIASLFTRSVPALVLVSAFLFSLEHVHVGVSGILTALPPGIFLSWCFLLGRRRSRWRAYWTTSAAHAVHNACALLLYACLQGF